MSLSQWRALLCGDAAHQRDRRAHGVRGDLARDLSSFGLGLTLCGLAIGHVLAAIASRLLTNLLYGFRPHYIATVALACFVPARRASRVDPMIALRQE